MPAHYAFNYYAGIFDGGLCITKSDNVPPTYGHFFACSMLHMGEYVHIAPCSFPVSACSKKDGCQWRCIRPTATL